MFKRTEEKVKHCRSKIISNWICWH